MLPACLPSWLIYRFLQFMKTLPSRWRRSGEEVSPTERHALPSLEPGEIISQRIAYPRGDVQILAPLSVERGEGRCDSLIRERSDSCLQLNHEVVQSNVPPLLQTSHWNVIVREGRFNVAELRPDLGAGGVEAIDEVVVVHVFHNGKPLQGKPILANIRSMTTCGAQRLVRLRLTIRTDCKRASWV